MKIKLITSDFKGSKYQSNFDCPFARALKRYFPHANICVGGIDVNIDGDNHYFNHQIWNANEVKEVEYELDIPGLL